jgi:hypothetical protein
LYFRNQQGLTAHTHQKHPKEETANAPDSTSKPKKAKAKQSRDRFQCTFCPKIFTTIDPLYQVAF